MRYFKKIPGDRIYLSPINPDDYEQYYIWMNDAEVADNIGLASQIYSIQKEKKILDEMASSGYHFAVIRSEDDKLIGGASLHDINQRSRNAQCGLYIGDAENRGKGYGTETLRLLLNYGFRTLNLNNVMLKCFSYNKQGIACYKKVGFKLIGERRNSCFVNGQYHNDMFMDILAEEFYNNA